MKLKAVLRQHDKFKVKDGLKDVLGDSYLLRMNPMFRQTRSLARRLGYRFVPARDAYKRAPLFELQTVLKKKTIPFNDVVPTLKRIVKDHGLDDDMDDIPVNLVSSHFHEAAHCISDAHFGPIKAKTKNEKILVALLCESYANATESMAVAFVDGEVQQFFLAQNSYIYANQERAGARQKALQLWGATALFRLLWMSYLYSNFLIEEVSSEELERVLRFALRKSELTKVDVSLGTSLFGDAYELNMNFRYSTARPYMRLLGMRGSVESNLGFDFVQLFQRNEPLLEKFDSLAEMSSRDLEI